VWRTVWRHSRIHIHHWTAVYRHCPSKALFIPFDFFFRYFAIRFTDLVPFTQAPPPPPYLDTARIHYHPSSFCSETIRYYRPYCCCSFHSSSLVFFFSNFVYSLFTVMVFIPGSLGPIHRVTFVNSLIFFFSFNIICAYCLSIL